MDFQFMSRSIEGLSDKQLAAFAPSIFAKSAHPDVSDKYGFLPTTEILKAMRAEGFVPMEARHYMRRAAAEREFTKHMIRFRAAGVKPQVVGDCVPQIVLVNSHDRSSKAELYGGLYRLVCENGLLVSDSSIVSPVVVRHNLNPVAALLASVEKIIQDHKSVHEHVKEMRAIKLSDRQQVEFAAEALSLRNKRRTGVLTPEAMLTARRTGDAGDALWNVFNRVQENMIKGGLEGVTADGRRTKTGPVESMRNDMRFNAGLWELAMATIAKARASSTRRTSKATA